MRKWKLAATATAASGILAVGMFAAFSLVAKAAPAPVGCSDSYSGTVPGPSALTCSYDAGIGADPALIDPGVITISAATTPSGMDITYVWSSSCVQNNTTTPVADNNGTGTILAAGQNITLQYQQLGLLALATSCDLNVKATITNDAANTKIAGSYLDATSLQVQISYTENVLASPSASPSSSPTTSVSTPAPTTKYYNNQVHGFDGTCMDDKGNSSAERTKVIIWSCNDTDQAQGWTYSGDELKIHGVCLNAKGNGKSGSKLILWQCTGSGNEIFVHRSNGEFAEKANGYTVCLDDPAYSTKNGTQLTVYTCNNGANQHFTKP